MPAAFSPGLGAVICWALWRMLPESPRRLEAVGRTEEAEEVTAAFEESARRTGKNVTWPTAR